jgi:hypothetical protein
MTAANRRADGSAVNDPRKLVGGTLSVGGVGETSYRLGAQVDHVSEMDVVTGKGNLVTSAPERQSELFHSMSAGMGQRGFITRAQLRLLSTPKNKRPNRGHIHDPVDKPVHGIPGSLRCQYLRSSWSQRCHGVDL